MHSGWKQAMHPHVMCVHLPEGSVRGHTTYVDALLVHQTYTLVTCQHLTTGG